MKYKKIVVIKALKTVLTVIHSIGGIEVQVIKLEQRLGGVEPLHATIHKINIDNIAICGSIYKAIIN